MTGTFTLLLMLELGNAFNHPAHLPSFRSHGKEWSLTKLSSLPFDEKRGVKIDEDSDPKHRFYKTASLDAFVESPCIVTIQGRDYNMTAWAKSHPGGNKVLQKFHNKDATKAFFDVGHSKDAVEMLDSFLIEDNILTPNMSSEEKASTGFDKIDVSHNETTMMPRMSRLKMKLFTKEDPIGIHKYCGIFVLIHFVFRFFQSWFGDPSAGFGNRMGKGPSFLSLACIIPHTTLSLSSLIFNTVPKERIVGKPMIVSKYL